MKKLLILVLIVGAAVFGILVGRITNVVQSDPYRFRQLKVSSKVKYLVKAAYHIININLHSREKQYHPKETLLNNKKILLLGASISQFWYVNEYFPFIKSLAVYRFDKTQALNEYLTQKDSRNKPDAVILKECAAFLPSDPNEFNKALPEYQKIYLSMVQIVTDHGIVPILATVCPVTHRGDHLNNILAFNDWLRAFAKNQNFAIFDIEETLRVSKNDRVLKKKLSQTDGLHLTREAYEEYLNPKLVTALLKALSSEKKGGDDEYSL
jgi:hypothetical protein